MIKSAPLVDGIGAAAGLLMPFGSVIVNALSFRTDQAEVAYRAADEGMYLKNILCFKYRRRVTRDNTVRYR